MSKFLTPPVWYDKNGNLIEMLSGTAMPAGNGPTLTNLAIGKSSEAGTPNQNVSMFGTAVGYNAKAYDNSTALGSSANAKSGIAIGFNTNATGGGIGIGGNATGGGIGIGGNATGGGIAIGAGASATANQIQLGDNNTAYTLNIGNGTGTSKIGALSFNEVSSTDIQSKGLYLCTATKTQSGAGATTTFGFSAFLWIEASRSTTVSTTDGSATFTYSNPEGQSNWAIRVSGADSNTLKCYRVFSLQD